VQLPGSQCQVSRAEWSTGKASQGQTQPSIVRIRTQAEHCVQHKASSTPSVLLASCCGNRCGHTRPQPALPALARQHGALVGGRVGAVARAVHLPRLDCLGGRAAEQALLALRQPLAGLRARLEAEYLRGARRAVRRVRCGRPRTGARRGARAAVRAGRAPGSSHTYAQPVRRPGIWRKPAPSCLGQQRAGFQGRLCGRTHTRKDLAQQHA